MSKDGIKKVVLAYSGGLDTSIILRWLQDVYECEVVTFTADIGQGEELEPARKKAEMMGIKEIYIDDLKEEFVRDFVFPMFRANTLYEGTYLLGTSIARPLIAKRLVEIAVETGADAIAHGATGKGNDQVRFEIGYQSLMPEVKIIAPWKIEKFYKAYPGRAELIEYAQAHGIPVKATKSQPWSSDENLMHISFEAGMLEDPWTKPLPEMFELSVSPQEAPNQATELLLDFEDGAPVKLNGEALSPAKMLSKLNDIAGANGVGRVDMVESRYVGMKSRGVYETPGGTVLMAAHRAIESITLTRDVIDLKDSLMPRFAAKVYSGYWFTPEMELLLSLIQQSQLGVNGQVRLELYKGNVTITGRRSPHSLYDADIASMEKDKGNYNIADANGFIRLNALPYKIYRRARGNK